MSMVLAHEEPELSPTDHLRAEVGWHEVRSGLGRILAGYGILIGGNLFCIGLVVVSVTQIMKSLNGPPLASLWLMYLGLALTSLISMTGYGFIVAGKWRCLMNAPERRGSRWLIFACITCLLMGPALNVAAGLMGLKRAPDIRRGPDGIMRAQFTEFGTGMIIAGAVVGLSSYALFILFLRAVAQCFDDKARTDFITTFLVLATLMAGATLYVVIKAQHLLARPLIVYGLLGGWAILFLGYLSLIVSIRNCIGRGMGELRSPLDPTHHLENTGLKSRITSLLP